MTWNQPGNGGSNQQDPWNSKKNPGPPDLDKLIGQFISKLKGFFTSSNSSPRIFNQEPTNHNKELGIGAGVIAAIIFGLWVVSGFYIVNPAEQAVILRFGKFDETQQPGLHWMARFIDTKYLVDVQKIYSFSLQGDFLTKSSEQGDLPNQVSANDLASTPSADRSKNLVNVELNVQYRVADPLAYLFNVANPDDTIQQVATGALSDVIGQMKLDEVLTTGREYLSSGMLDRIRHILGGYNTGLEVVAVTLRKVQAPDQVKEAFNDVNRADQDKATYTQQAQAYASKVVPLAQGDAARMLADANAYQTQVVLNAQAQVAKFQAVYNVYKTSPDVTRQRLYLETMQSIFNKSNKLLVDSGSGNNVLYLPIDQLMKQSRDEVAPTDTSHDVPAQLGSLMSLPTAEVNHVTQ